MGYDIRAFITQQGLLKTIQEKYPQTVIIPLEQGFEMLLNTWHFCWGFPESEQEPALALDFATLNGALIEMFANLSTGGRVAYIEIECFGGYCEQYGIVWDQGKVIFGPELVKGGIGPANRALQTLGLKALETCDEFDTSGLALHRHIEDWYEEYTGKSYAPDEDNIS